MFSYCLITQYFRFGKQNNDSWNQSGVSTGKRNDGIDILKVLNDKRRNIGSGTSKRDRDVRGWG